MGHDHRRLLGSFQLLMGKVRVDVRVRAGIRVSVRATVGVRDRPCVLPGSAAAPTQRSRWPASASHVTDTVSATYFEVGVGVRLSAWHPSRGAPLGQAAPPLAATSSPRWASRAPRAHPGAPGPERSEAEVPAAAARASRPRGGGAATPWPWPWRESTRAHWRSGPAWPGTVPFPGPRRLGLVLVCQC